MTEALRYEADLPLSRPVLVAAFRGWNDAGDAATSAAKFLADAGRASTFATLDADGYVDFQFHRPMVTLEGGVVRSVSWPDTTFAGGELAGAGRDVIVVTGWEPSMRWRSFCAEIVDVARRYEVRETYTLGGVLSDIPHSRPVYVLGTASSQDGARRLGLETSEYKGPTGIVTVLTAALQDAGFESVSLWAHVPYYVPRDQPSPKAALALITELERLTGAQLHTDSLQEESEQWERWASDFVANDPELAARVAELESRASAVDTGRSLSAEGDPNLAEALAEQFQRFLQGLDGEAE